MSSSSDQMLTETKTKLIRAFPFLAFIIISTKYTIVKDHPQIKTMAATIVGSTPLVLIDEEFLMNKLVSVEERAFVIAHELMHIYFMHLGRQQDRGYNHKLWNVATDFYINYMLCDLKSKHVSMPSFGLYDEKFANMSSDEIYYKIIEDNEDDQKGGSNGNGGGDDQKGEGTSAGDQYGDPGDDDRPSPFDEVGSNEITDDQAAELKAQLAGSLQGGTLAGTMANSSLVKALYELISPTVSWRDVLRDYVTKSRNEFYSYRRYNSRSGEIILPSSDGESVNVLFGIDTSGSMSDEDLAEGLTELNEIISEFCNWKVQFVTCEMEVDCVGTYTSEEGDDFTSFASEYKRGGGTDMNPIIEHAESIDDTPEAIIIITDGFLSVPLTPSHLPVIVIVTRSGNKDFTSDDHEVIHID